MSDRNALVARVQKLLDRAKDSTNEHEASTALALAQKAMAEHRLTDRDLLAGSAEEVFTHTGAKLRVPSWEAALALGVGQAFGCDPVHHQRNSRPWSWIGTGPGPALAAYGFDVLYRQVVRARRQYIDRELRRVRKTSTKTQRADLYARGWVHTAIAQVTRQERTEADQQAVDAYLAYRYPDAGSLKPRDHTRGRQLREHEKRDLRAGQRDGRAAELRPGVGATPVPRLPGRAG